jgi:transcriptional regulator GlxA family with amidase domain
MNIAILTFDGFNELDSFIAFGLLNRMKPNGWNVQITCPTAQVTSMNGLTIDAQQDLEFANTADAVIFGSGLKTRDIVQDKPLLARLSLNSDRQLIAAQCSGTLLMATLGLLEGLPACTDLISKPWIKEAGVEVLNQPFFAKANVATAGGCLASQYLAAWILLKLAGLEAAKSAIYYVAPVGEKEASIAHNLAVVEPFLQ